VVEGRAVLDAEKLTIPGFYSLTAPDQPEGKPVIAVNLLRQESDLTPVVEAEIPKQLGVDKAAIAHDLDALRNLISEHRIGRTFGEHLLWLALGLIAIEFVYANVLGRSKERRPDRGVPGAPLDSRAGIRLSKSESIVADA
jgi:hypothetical protein